MKQAKNVDEYIDAAPKDVQNRLKQIRKIIKDCAPKALEKISYGMPYYDLNGRLAYFSYFKKHIGLYIPGSMISDHKKELEGYGTSTATVRFPHNEKLPISLIQKLIEARTAESEKIR